MQRLLCLVLLLPVLAGCNQPQKPSEVLGKDTAKPLPDKEGIIDIVEKHFYEAPGTEAKLIVLKEESPAAVTFEGVRVELHRVMSVRKYAGPTFEFPGRFLMVKRSFRDDNVVVVEPKGALGDTHVLMTYGDKVKLEMK